MKNESQLNFEDIAELYSIEDVFSLLNRENPQIVALIISQLSVKNQESLLQRFDSVKQNLVILSMQSMRKVRESVIEKITRSYIIQLNEIIESRNSVNSNLLFELRYHNSIKGIKGISIKYLKVFWKSLTVVEKVIILKFRKKDISQLVPSDNYLVRGLYFVWAHIAKPSKLKIVQAHDAIIKLIEDVK